MTKRRRKKLKKLPIIIILAAILIGGYMLMNKNTLANLGYSKEEIDVIESNGELLEVAKKGYEANLVKLVGVDGFLASKLDNYLAYLKKYDASLEEAVSLVNLGIEDKYSKEVVLLTKEKYFIKENLDLYLENLTSDYEETIRNVNTKIIYDYYTNMEEARLDQANLVLVNKYYYLSKDYEPSDLEAIDSSYNIGANNKLRHEAKEAFEKMCAAASLDNIKLYNISAYRSYETQEKIYNRNVLKNGVSYTDKYSARPGNSEHQTGLATDINSLDTDFEYTSEFKWLSNNAYKYGFILRYPKEYINVTGYSYEPWHYRYVGISVSKTIHDENITFEEYYAYYLR